MELVAFHVFRQEYEEYLDAVLGDDRLLMKHKIERIGEKYTSKSILRELLRGTITNPEMLEGIVTREEILKDKLMIELIENPKKLWKYLSVRVRNTWIVRVITRKRLKKFLDDSKVLHKVEDAEFKSKGLEFLAKLPFNGGYWNTLKGFLRSEILNSKNLPTLLRSLKSIERNAFRTYFFNVFLNEEIQDVREQSSDKQKGTGKKVRQKIRGLDDF